MDFIVLKDDQQEKEEAGFTAKSTRVTNKSLLKEFISDQGVQEYFPVNNDPYQSSIAKVPHAFEERFLVNDIFKNSETARLTEITNTEDKPSFQKFDEVLDSSESKFFKFDSTEINS